MSTGESKIELPTMSYGLAGPSGTEPLDTTTMPHVPGYEIVRLVGEGGMGIVFEAFQLKPRRRVALKIIRPGLLSDAMLQSFNQEIEILGRLTHPAIAHIYEAGTAELSGQQHPYFAMEYVEGTPITAYAEANRLTLPERINLLIRISDGVHHAHQKGVIHRDLKPGNILVDESGSPRILDFGVSRVIEQDTTQHASRHVGELLGTPAYMAPEQAAGDDAQADVRADVYSLGVVAYELLTGERPHKLKGLPVSKAVEVILQETPRRLGRYDRRFRGDLEIIVAKALEKDRDDRYDSVAAWAADLGRYMRNEPIWARAPSACYQVAKFAKRNAVLVASVVLVFLALLFGMTAAGIGLFRARAAEAESNRQRERALVNLHQAIDTVDRFMTLVARGELAAIPEASAVRQHLLRDAIAFYERFLEKNRDDPRLQEALSWSLVHLATAYGEIGAIEQATELRARHIRKVTRRLETERDTLELRHELARSLSELGVLLRRQGEEHQAVSRLNQAEQKYRHLLALDPENERYLREYARNFCEKGEALAAAGAGDKAVVARKKAANIRQQLLLAHPSSLEYKRDLARSFSERSSLLRRQGRLAEARNAAEEAVALRRRLVTRAPHNMHYLKDLAKGLKALGFVCSSLGDAQAAETAFREATDLHRKRVEAYPRQNEYIRDLARSLHDWARLLRADGRLDEAIDMLLEANELFQKLPAHGPHYQKYRSDLARNYSEQGQTHTQMNDHATAQAKFRQAHQIIEELMLRNPGHPDLQRDLAMLLNNWSLAVSPQEATELLEEARPILEELVHARPAVSSLRRALSWNASQLLRHELSKDSSARTSARRESIPGFGKSPADGFFQVDEPQNEFPPPRRLDARATDKIRSALGQHVVVAGRVVYINTEVGANQVSFIRMTRDRPSFSGVIHRASLPAFRENFGEDFDKNLRGRAVELEGIVSTYGESLQIVLSRPQQLRLTDPAIMHQDRSLRTISSSDLAGLEQAEGDIVFIRGHVRSVSTSPQHATFINLDEAFSAIIRAANLRVIQRVWGEDLSARLSGQEIKLVGKVYRHTGGWGIALERPEQIIFDPSAKSL